jgi:predicted Zn-dependent protease
MIDLEEKIKDIIDDVVGITEGNYGWAGQEYILTNTDKAAKMIMELIKKSKNAD